jgi:hypothetical protein
MWSFSGEFDPAWLTQPITWSDYLAGYLPFLERMTKRGNLEGKWRFQADLDQLRDEIEDLWKDGDELWGWHHRFCPRSPCGHAGLVVLRKGTVIRVWITRIIQ